MTCTEFAAALCLHSQLTPAARIHVSDCEPCRALLALDRQLAASPEQLLAPRLGLPLRALLAEQAGAAVTPGPSLLLRVLGAVVVAAFAVLSVASVGGRADLLEVARGPLQLAFVALAALPSVWLFSYLRRDESGLLLSAGARALVLCAGLVAFELQVQLYLALSEAARGPLSIVPPRDCLLLGVLVAAAVSVVLFGLNRRSLAYGQRSAGALLGGVCGAIGALCLHVHCPAVEPWHLRVVHLLPMLVAIGAGAWAGPRWLGAVRRVRT